MNSVIIYETENGKSPFSKWLNSIRDNLTFSRIQTRIFRIENGNFGDTKSVGKGVWELKLNFGSGYRIYYGLTNNSLVIILMGGDKSTQKKDIKIAQIYWSDYLRRNQNG